MRTDLSAFKPENYEPGRSLLIRGLWFVLHAVFIQSAFPFSRPKIWLLRWFGCNIHHSVLIRPFVYIKYPWKLSIQAHTWIGEGVRIDNVGEIRIGSNCCLSQHAKLISGNHDFRSPHFDLIPHRIELRSGVWICAGAMLCGNVICEEDAVLTAGSIASGTLRSNTVYKGNPAEAITIRYAGSTLRSATVG